MSSNGRPNFTTSAKTLGKYEDEDDFGSGLPSRYKIIRKIGFGAFALVFSAKDETDGRKVAVKKISNVHKHMRKIIREIRLLRFLSVHENIIGIKDIIIPKPKPFDELYLVCEYMETDLSKIIQSPITMREEHIQLFLYQILRGLLYVHSAGIVHRDLKPENILVNSNCDLKIADFGMGRVFGANLNLSLLETVTTRWYNAPEQKNYNSAVDIWSTGCILAEMIGRAPLFTGKDRYDQLRLIVEVLGRPSEEEIAILETQKMKDFVRDLRPKEKLSFGQMYPHANPKGKIVVFDPNKRISAEEALSHPYLSSLHDPSDEPKAPMLFEDDLERQELTNQNYQDLIYQEYLAYHPDAYLSHV